jgi:hypothetical protein
MAIVRPDWCAPNHTVRQSAGYRTRCRRRVPAVPSSAVAVDLVGTAHVPDVFGEVIAPGGSGIVFASQAGHMLPPLPAEQTRALASTPADDLTGLPLLQSEVVTNLGSGVRAGEAGQHHPGPGRQHGLG